MSRHWFSPEISPETNPLRKFIEELSVRTGTWEFMRAPNHYVVRFRVVVGLENFSTY